MTGKVEEVESGVGEVWLAGCEGEGVTQGCESEGRDTQGQAYCKIQEIEVTLENLSKSCESAFKFENSNC